MKNNVQKIYRCLLMQFIECGRLWIVLYSNYFKYKQAHSEAGEVQLIGFKCKEYILFQIDFIYLYIYSFVFYVSTTHIFNWPFF
jgi:hypothetical protein